MNTVPYRGVARIFPEVRTIFKSPYPPTANSKFDRQKHSHWRNRAVKTGLSENNMFTFYTTLLAICVHLKVYHQDSYENQLSDVGEKSLFFGKPIFRCGKNKQSIVSGKILQRIKQR